MLKKLWKKTVDSAVVLNNRIINNFKCSSSSEYSKISPENADGGFTCTIEEQKCGEKHTTSSLEKKLLNLGSQVSLSTKKKNKVSSVKL